MNKKKIFYSLVAVLVLVFAFAALSPVFADEVVKLSNPLGEKNNDPRVIVGNIIKALLGIVGSVALLVFISGGFMWVIAGGNEEKVKRGKDMVFWASLGLAMIFFSYAMVNFVLGALSGSVENVGTTTTGVGQTPAN